MVARTGAGAAWTPLGPGVLGGRAETPGTQTRLEREERIISKQREGSWMYILPNALMGGGGGGEIFWRILGDLRKIREEF